MQTVVHCPNANLSIVPEGWSLLPFQPSGHSVSYLVSRASFNEMTERRAGAKEESTHRGLPERADEWARRWLELLAVEGSAGPGFQSQPGHQLVRCACNCSEFMNLTDLEVC